MTHQKSKHPIHAVTAVALAVACLLNSSVSVAASLTLAQVPQGKGGREPAPNIIVSVDDSGSMGSNGINALKAALTSAFSPSKITDDSIRLGFQSMWRCRGLVASPYKNASGGPACPDTRIQYFSGTHRTNFNAWVNALTPEGGTPSHSMLANVHQAMGVTGVWSPFAEKPGVTDSSPPLACRKTFMIYMTDGGWKDTGDHKGISTDATGMGLPGNADGTSMTFPDGTVFDPYGTTAAQTKIYRDPYVPVSNDALAPGASRGTVATFSDWIFKMWATDYAPTVDNKVEFKPRDPGSIDVGTPGSPYLISEYWNPRNNPMTWQGVTTYTIGFNNAANVPTTRKTWKQYDGYPTETVQSVTLPAWGGDTWSGDYKAMLRGDAGLSWPNPLRGWPLHYQFNQWLYNVSLGTDGAYSPNNGPTADYGKIYELWHAAINGRGRFVPATSSAQLTAAFNEILSQIQADTNAPLVGISANTQSVRSETLAFVAGYDATNWSGNLKGYAINAAGGVNASAIWDAATQLDAIAPASRKIWTHNGTEGKEFVWNNLAADQQLALRDIGTVATGQARLDYLRGDRTKEESKTGGTFRNRVNLLGDIVHSAPWNVGKPNMGYLSDGYQAFRTANASRLPMVYIGTNSGMLHGFAVKAPLVSGVPTLSDGAEKMAYVPRGVYNGLATYTDPAYAHRYYVDGKPFTSDFYNGTAWKTALVGTLAGGGKGFFVIDVTNPAGFASATSTDIANLVMTDKTATFTPSTVVGTPLAATWDDMGHMYSPPSQDNSNPDRIVQITKLNNNRWALLMGNGVNSNNETAVLLIQYLDGNKELVKLTADSTVGGGNGLSHPQVIDLNGDDKADLVYAGDIKGNLWKFDLTSATASNWKVAFSGDPLFVARGYAPATPAGASGEPQAIMTAPTWTTNPMGGLNLVFATGRDLTATDPASTAVQTLYSVWDNTSIAMPTTPSGTVTLSGGSKVPDSSSGGRASLLQRTQVATTTTTEGVFSTTSSSTAVNYSGASAQRGWFFNFPLAGERAEGNSRIIDKRLVAIPSVKLGVGSMTSSTAESCDPKLEEAEYFTTVLDAVTGKPYQKRAFFDTNGGGWTGTEISNVSRVSTGKDPVLFKPAKSSEKFATSFKMVSGRPGGSEPDKAGVKFGGADSNLDAGVLDDPVRTSWRQLQ